MTIEQMKKVRRDLGLTYSELAALSGLSPGTVQRIFSGVTQMPHRATQKRLSQIFEHWQDICGTGSALRENESRYRLRGKEEIPPVLHQAMLLALAMALCGEVERTGGTCCVLPGPVDILAEDESYTLASPDLAVVCDRRKITARGIAGGPELCIEISAPASERLDLSRKLEKYAMAGVQEYWLVDPLRRRVVLCRDLQGEESIQIRGFGDKAPVWIFDGACVVDFKKITKQLGDLMNLKS